MNARRAAEIHREIAKLHEELAEAMAPDERMPEASPSRPRKLPRVHPGPLHPPTDLDIARAQKMLRRRGMAT